MAKKQSSKAHNGKAAEPPAEGVYFLSMSLENVRCFGEKQTLDLSDGKGRPARWTILLGNNGTGKTTVLQALALHVLFWAELQGHGTQKPSNLSSIMFGREDFEFLRGDEPLGELLSQLGTCAGIQKEVRPFDQSIELLFQFKAGVTELRVQKFPERVIGVPSCYGYGAGRRLGKKSPAESEARTLSLDSLFWNDADLRNGEDWLLRLDYSASKESDKQAEQQRRLEQIKVLLREILPEVDDVRFVGGSGPVPIPRVEFQTPFGWIRLRRLGYGYQTLIAWMVDFASRMVERYPDSPNPLAEPAVVLVDEIDLHLHPFWQRKLIGELTERFPNTQFIATAHSPLVVQAAGDANIAVLRREGDHVVIDNERNAVRGWRVDQILTSDLYDLPTAWPPEFDEPLRRRKELLTKPKRTAAENRELEKLEKQIRSLPLGESADQVRTMDLLRETLEVLQQKVPPKS